MTPTHRNAFGVGRVVISCLSPKEMRRGRRGPVTSLIQPSLPFLVASFPYESLYESCARSVFGASGRNRVGEQKRPEPVFWFWPTNLREHFCTGELPRISLPRTSVYKGIKKGR